MFFEISIVGRPSVPRPTSKPSPCCDHVRQDPPCSCITGTARRAGVASEKASIFDGLGVGVLHTHAFIAVSLFIDNRLSRLGVGS